MKRSDDSEVVVGDRIECQDYFGSVKFIGEVESMEGVWLGIEWDDISRGKHDGSYKGRRYFQTSRPKSGSFVKSVKVKLGQGFSDAYHYKTYVMNVPLKQLILSKCSVYGLGSKPMTNQFSTVSSYITYLDLSFNLLKNWTDVAGITVLMPNVSILDLRNNRLIIPENLQDLSKSFNNVKTLNLMEMNYKWSEILLVASMFSSLSSLYAGGNTLVELTDCSGQLTTLEYLSLIDNQIRDWNQVLKLSQLPLLNTLYLNNNQLSQLFFDDVTLENGDKTCNFPSLKCLELDDNLIDNLSTVDQLSKLAKLEALSLKRNPLKDTYNDKLFELIIGKIGTLKKNSRSDVRDDERKSAEIFYLHMIEKQAFEKNISEEETARQCSRYKELVAKYGRSNPGSLLTKNHVLKDKLIVVNIEQENLPNKVIKDKKLSPSMTILKLKYLVQRLFALDQTDQVGLYYISQKNPEIKVDLDKDLLPLHFYSIENGDRLIVK
ncbi:tubulin-specific chaperone E-like [Argonauta hians]